MWHCWQFSWIIGATSLAYVTSCDEASTAPKASTATVNSTALTNAARSDIYPRMRCSFPILIDCNSYKSVGPTTL